MIQSLCESSSYRTLALAAWVVAATLTLTAQVEAQNAAGGTPKELLAQAYAVSQKAQGEGDYSQIIALCEQALRSNPTPVNTKYAHQLMSWSLNRRGEIRSDEDKEDVAQADFDRALELNGDNWRALHNRGVSLALKGKNPEALAAFNKVIEIEQGFANAYFNRGELLSAQGRWQDAIADYTRASRLNVNDPRPVTNRGYAYYRLGNHNQALADFNQALSVDKEWPAAYVHRAAIYGDTGKWGQAATDYRTAIQVAPDFGLAYQQSAWLMATCPDAKYRDPKLALDAAKRAIEIDGDGDFHYLDTLSAAYAANGKFNEAIEGLKKAISTLPAGFELFKPELETRLALYEKKEAYIEPQPLPDPVTSKP